MPTRRTIFSLGDSERLPDPQLGQVLALRQARAPGPAMGGGFGRGPGGGGDPQDALWKAVMEERGRMQREQLQQQGFREQREFQAGQGALERQSREAIAREQLARDIQRALEEAARGHEKELYTRALDRDRISREQQRDAYTRDQDKLKREDALQVRTMKQDEDRAQILDALDKETVKARAGLKGDGGVAAAESLVKQGLRQAGRRSDPVLNAQVAQIMQALSQDVDASRPPLVPGGWFNQPGSWSPTDIPAAIGKMWSTGARRSFGGQAWAGPGESNFGPQAFSRTFLPSNEERVAELGQVAEAGAPSLELEVLKALRDRAGGVPVGIQQSYDQPRLDELLRRKKALLDAGFKLGPGF